MPASSSSCRLVPVDPLAPAPLEETGTYNSSSCSSSPSPPRVRRHRRVLYPASQCRRPPMRDAPDQARRWLLLFSALVFLQIYTEETSTCTEPQIQCPDPAASQIQESDGSLGTSQAWTGEEPWRVQIMTGPSETPMDCVVS